MSGEIIRQGDPTSHGGRVLEGSLLDICHGKPIAYVGHKVFCPMCKGIFPIIEGVLTATFYGKGVAIAGMRTSCGASLIPTQFTDIVEYASGAVEERAVDHKLMNESGFCRSLRSADQPPPGSNLEAGTITDPPLVKRIVDIFWTYGPNEYPVSQVSRHYVDLNLHVKTRNHSAGELVKISISSDISSDQNRKRHEIEVEVIVGSDGTGKVLNVFKGRTLEIGMLGT